MSDKLTASPRPWYVDHAPWMGLKFGVMYQGNVVAECREITPDSDRANAAHIVKCVNYHEKLIEALEDVADAMNAYNHAPGATRDEWDFDEEWGMIRKLLNELDT